MAADPTQKTPHQRDDATAGTPSADRRPPPPPARVDASVVLLYTLGGLLGFLAALLFLLPGLAGGDSQLSLLERLRQQFSPNAFAVVAGFVTAGVALADMVQNRRRTEERETENSMLRDSVQSKTELISSITHQMRTPLTSVKYALKMFLSGDFGPVNDEQRGILQNVYGSTENLVTLTQDFLDASKLDTGKLQIAFKTSTLADLGRSLEATVDRLRPMAEGKHITLRHIAKLKAKLSTRVDGNKLNQVVESLVENAINYTPRSGQIEVRVGSDDRSLTVRVKDSGIGIPEAEQAKVFSKFFRASNAQAESSTGTGIGLFISKKFVEAHQGKIWFTSRTGRGSTFTFTVPLQPPSVVEQLFIRI